MIKELEKHVEMEEARRKVFRRVRVSEKMQDLEM